MTAKPRAGHLAIRIERDTGFALVRLVDTSGLSVTVRLRPQRADALACLLSSVARKEATSYEIDVLGYLEIRHAPPPV